MPLPHGRYSRDPTVAGPPWLATATAASAQIHARPNASSLLDITHRFPSPTGYAISQVWARRNFLPVREDPDEDWRRHPGSNRGITDLQSVALPLGYAAAPVSARSVQPHTRRSTHPCLIPEHPAPRRGENSSRRPYSRRLAREWRNRQTRLTW